MGARTDAARAEVVARRQVLGEEIVKLQASGRAAVDIPAKIRKAPAKTAALAASSAFLLLGGPGRGLRIVRRLVFGPAANLPKSMLPDQIEKAVRSLGKDGNRVRGVLEHEFAGYLEQNSGKRGARDLPGTISELGGNLLRPITFQAGKRLAAELLRPDGGSFASALDRIRNRQPASEAGGGEPLAEPKSGPEAQPSRWPRRPGGRNILRPR